MTIIADFERELRRRVALRDPDATVHTGRTPATMITGEYVCVVETARSREMSAFNPEMGNWILVYER